MNYTCKITKSVTNGRTFYDVEFPDIPDVFSCADTLTQARENAADVLNAMLAAKLDNKEPLPIAKTKADSRKGLESIAVDDRLAIAYTIFEARRGKSAAEIARKMGISRRKDKNGHAIFRDNLRSHQEKNHLNTDGPNIQKPLGHTPPSHLHLQVLSASIFHPELFQAVHILARQISKKHRLVYRIFETEIHVDVLSAYGHYDDK